MRAPDDPTIEAFADRQSAQVIQIESSKLLPWLALCLVLCGLSLGGSFVAVAIAQSEIRHVSERLAETTKQYRLLDNDWQITNAWLASHHVVKDIHGNYYFEESDNGR